MARRRLRTEDAELDALIADLLDRAGVDEDRDLLLDILATAVRLAGDEADRLDLKIVRAVLREMRASFAAAAYQGAPKVTIFGSARTTAEDPLYVQARELAKAMADEGWMVVTGAGPGIMAAGLEGAGRDMSFGVTIRLPFEESVNEFIAGDPKLVSMKYFFTRKLALVKESSGFVCMPGGFGTLDETFELLTLQQTGKMAPVPIVLVDVPGGTYWDHWDRFVHGELMSRGLVSEGDDCLYRITDDVSEACAEITGFYRVYHSVRWVGIAWSSGCEGHLRGTPDRARRLHDELWGEGTSSRPVLCRRRWPTTTTSTSPASSSTWTSAITAASGA